MPQYWELVAEHPARWTRYYGDGLYGAIEEDTAPGRDPYLWILFIDRGPNLDVGRNATAGEAMAATDYNARSDYVRRHVKEWRRPRVPRPPTNPEPSALWRLRNVKAYYRHI